MSDFLFTLVLALFATHELDAVYRHEWRIFPYLDAMEDKRAAALFITAHFPLLLLIVWLAYAVPLSGEPMRVALSAFAIVHIWLHWLLRGHVKCEFNNTLSQALIWATGAAGALWLVIWVIN